LPALERYQALRNNTPPLLIGVTTNMTKHSLLLIDDDIDFCELLVEYLSTEDFIVKAVHDGQTGYEQAVKTPYDIIILDVMLPKLNGYDALKKIKAKISTPVLMLTAKGDEVDQVIGLEIGADDYLPKPCSPRLLVARLKAILRRLSPEINEEKQELIVDNIRIDYNLHQVTISEQLIEITNSEYNILKCLMEKVGKVVSKEELSEKGLNRKIAAFDRSVDMHISHLRSKVGSTKSGQPKIKTIRGVGYMLETE
jgi:DNA-binding response OmpR family regulator